MTHVTFTRVQDRARLGVKGPGAADWLSAHGIELPAGANRWVETAPAPRAPSAAGELPSPQGALLVARLGSSEFFLEQAAGGAVLDRLSAALDGAPPGVYPVLREDWAFVAQGAPGSTAADACVHAVLAQICNVEFAAIETASHLVIMTLMIGVAVLVVPQEADGTRRYRVWCDPTFGHYLAESVGNVVSEANGRNGRVSA